jgi:competence protein ComEC
MLGALWHWLSRRPVIDEPDEDARPSFRLQPALGLTLALLIAAGWLAYDGWTADAAPSQLTVSVLDVGQGDATLIQTPAGLRVLVDGGPSTDRLLQALSKELAPAAHRLDLVVLSDARDEHASGLVEVLQRYEVGAVLTTPQLGVSPSFRALRDEIDRRDVPLLTATAGQTLQLGPGVQLQVVSPAATQPSSDAAPLVLRLINRNVSFLLAEALPAGDEPSLLNAGVDVRATALVLPRHGAESRWTRELIAATGPGLAIVSTGPRAMGMPAPATELALRGVPELRTDRNGSVRLRSDGVRLSVETERAGPRKLYQPSN